MKRSMVICDKIISLFSNTSQKDISIKENFEEVEIYHKCNIEKLPNIDDYNGILEEINKWDKTHLKIKIDDEIYTSKNANEFKELISSININDEVELFFTIIKNIQENVLSIYFVKYFAGYLEGLSFDTFINIISKYINNKLLILYNSDFNNIHLTNSIILCNDIVNLKEYKPIEYREERQLVAKSLCHWEFRNDNLLLPEDLYPVSSNNTEFGSLLQKTSLLYTSMFFFDYVNIKDNNLLYKLNGYRTFNEDISISSIKDIEISYSSYALMYEIYQWAYRGGNTSDKISIVRNIISLNFNPKSLELFNTVFDAIKSNYKIYERQNVKQYIEVRNKLSEILISLQEKIDRIVYEFISDYKKNFITLISFFISIIVIKVVSKGDFIEGFTNEIIILSYSFLLISVGILIYSRWEFNKRISMFNKHYSQLKNRYKHLLSENELNEIFEENNPTISNDKSFLEKQKKNYTILWILTIFILAIALAIIGLINNSNFIITI